MIMNRRHFLRNSSLTGITVSALGIPALAAETANPALPPPPGPFKDDFGLLETTVDALQQKMQKNEMTAVSITRLYLDRIQAIDKNGPKLNAVIEINPDALRIAAAMDQERKEGRLRGPLHGIPVLVKDNINTGDQMMTTAGSLALVGNKAPEDAFIIQQLRKAGAVLLGKTNLSEWANFRSSRSTSGWSSRGGQTKCPYILDRNPSGSSAGTGTATAANLCAIGIGTETDGSVVSPASVNGLVGIKPTVGLWSRTGIIPISATQDTAGPMTRTVRDAAILLGALTGVDPKDPATAPSEGHFLKDYTPFLKADGLKGKRIGIEKSHFDVNPALVKLLRAAIRTMEEAGATIVELDLLKPMPPGSAEFMVLVYEFKDGINRYLSTVNTKMKSMADLIAFNQANEASTMPYFKQETMILSQSKGGLDAKEYTDALAKSLSVRQLISDLMAKNNLDALSGITNGMACCIDLANGDYDNGPSLSTPPAMAGFPHITVPMGFAYGLPVGLSFFGTAYSEPQLISLAFSYENATKHRAAPGFQADFLT
jgi:amidase